MSFSLTLMTLDTLRKKRKEILALAERHKAEQVRVFGSLARGEASVSSDIDLLVHFRSGASLLDMIGLQQEASDLMNRPVDIVSDEAILPYLARRILSEAVPL